MFVIMFFENKKNEVNFKKIKKKYIYIKYEVIKYIEIQEIKKYVFIFFKYVDDIYIKKK